MARRTEQKQEPRGLSPAAAVVCIAVIDHVIDTFEWTAPRSVAELGGIDAIQARLQGMAVGETEASVAVLGPVPRLTSEEWQAMSAEYVDARSRYGHPGRCAEGPNPWAGAPAQGRGLGA